MKPALLILLLAASAAAQSIAPILGALKPQYETIKRNLIETAEVMPEADYGYKLTPAQRSFGEWMDHNVVMNSAMCAAALGRPTPEFRKGLTAKADLVAELKKSFALCDEAFAQPADVAVKEVAVNGKPSLPINTMIRLVANWNEHYGNLVGYLRTKGITPPSTARAMKK